MNERMDERKGEQERSRDSWQLSLHCKTTADFSHNRLKFCLAGKQEALVIYLTIFCQKQTHDEGKKARLQTAQICLRATNCWCEGVLSDSYNTAALNSHLTGRSKECPFSGTEALAIEKEMEIQTLK